MRRLNFIDLFAGCGGLSEGFSSNARFNGVAHVEWRKAPAETLRLRLAAKGWGNHDSVVVADINEDKAIFKGIGGLLDSTEGAKAIDLLIGGPPCQAYSLAGRIRDPNGMRDDYRNYLFEAYLRYAKRFRPAVLVFENVPGMLTASPGGKPIAERIRRGFHDHGYEILNDLRQAQIDFSQYGLPQSRRRIIIIAIRRASLGNQNPQTLLEYFYSTLRSHGLKQRQSVFDAIGMLPAPPMLSRGQRWTREWGELHSTHPLHVARFANARDREVFSALASDKTAERPKYSNTEKLKGLYTKVTGKTAAVHKYNVLDKAGLSNLIPAHLKKDGLRHIHYDPIQARTITMLEAAILQGFPIDYPFYGSQGEIFEMIGNAVPPTFSKVLARTILEVFA
jgi:DNA (cytosine-5)-methyltransferase 1